MMEYWQVKQRQALPFEAKVEMSKRRIREWYDGWDGLVYTSFSGGKDSSVLQHLVRSTYPDTPSVYVNTGLEFPENVKLVRQTENVIWLKPKMRYKEITQKYGFPVVSKETARKLFDLQNPTPRNKRTRDIRLGKTNSKHGHCPKKWLYLKDAPFPISDRCCDIMKKRPIKKYEKETGRKGFVGNLASEGRYRLWFYQKNGCNAFNNKRPYSVPIAFWTEADVWEYINRFNVPISTVYAMGYHRTGCVGCMFGVHAEETPNRFQRLQDTHPKLYRYTIDKLGCGKVLDYIGVEY
jgi:3'-phosphoadenosine 5'-phosphosulfate sulfotransferase (PAPS reductase)/FAD synthetase